MKNKYQNKILFFAFLFSFPRMQSPPNVEWLRFYGGSESDVANSIIETNSGDFVILGTTYSFGSGHSDVYMVKVNKSGDTLWTKTFGGSSWDYGNRIIETSDYGYLIAGATSSFGAPSWNMYIIRTDMNGDTLWTKTFQHTYDCTAQSIIETMDGGFLAVGMESWSSPGGGGAQDYIVKMDSLGHLLWSDSFIGGIPGPLFTYSFGGANDICETTSGDYLIFGAHDDSLTILKVGADGDSLTTKVYPNGSALSVTNTQDGHFAIGGFTIDPSNFNMKLLLMKVDENGDTIFTRTYEYGGNARGNSIISLADNGYAIYGASGNYPQYQSVLFRMDGDGNLLWSANFDISANDRGRGLIQTENGNIMLAGYTIGDSTMSNGNMYLVALAQGLSIIDDTGILPNNILLSSNYPNPFNHSTIIPFSLINNSIIQIRIFNELGKISV